MVLAGVSLKGHSPQGTTEFFSALSPSMHFFYLLRSTGSLLSTCLRIVLWISRCWLALYGALFMMALSPSLGLSAFVGKVALLV